MASDRQQDKPNSASSSAPPLAAIIMAAGKGTRMNSDLPKVAHEVAGRPMVWWVVNAVREAGADLVILVVGHGAEIVSDIFVGDDDDITYVTQSEQLGTGHAAECCREALSSFNGDVLVLAGDGPLIRAETIEQMRHRHVDCGAKGTLATSVIDDPTGYGRIARNADGRFEAIVEHKNCTPEQLSICEVYPSYAIFDCRSMFDTLAALKPNELTGEFYITDVPAMLHGAGHVVEVIDAVPPQDVLSINTLDQLALVDEVLRERLGPGAAQELSS